MTNQTVSTKVQTQSAVQPATSTSTFKPSTDCVKALKAYLKARAKKAAAEADMKAAAELIKAEILTFETATKGNVEEFTASGVHVIFREVESRKINTGELKKMALDVYERFSDTITTRPLKVN